MPDIFISYARPDEPNARQVAEALRSLGYRVWRDDELPAHRAYADVIQERLSAAKAVVVLWSADSVRSQWVRSEADVARQAGTLIQVSFDGTIPPMPFNQIQCADLKGWDGRTDAPGWRKLAASVGELAGAAEEAGDADARQARRRDLSVCVLPFANMSGDAEQEYFSDGISEDITTDLSKVSALLVTARNTAFTFKGQAVNVCNVARKLGVSHVLEGSVRKAGSRVRITAQLIDGASGDHLWAERYDRDLTDIFAIQDEISEAIVGALKLKLLPEEKNAIEQRGTASAEAYNLYLMARQYWITGNHGDRRRDERVIRICQRAVEVDPNYAQAWALMALGQSNLRYGFNEESADDGVSAAGYALAIDPNIAEAHCAIARHHAEEGAVEEAEAELATALRLNPNSWEVNKEAARFFFRQRRIGEARRHFEKAAALFENDFHAWGLLVSCYFALGEEEEARRAARMALAQADIALGQDPSNGAALGISASALAVLGERELAKERVQRAMLIDPDNLNTQYNVACALAEAHDPNAAIDMLGPVLARGSRTIVALCGNDPDFDSVREDPRFQKMLADAKRRLGIESAAPATPAAT